MKDKNKTFFDLTEEEQKEIIETAAKKSNDEQLKTIAKLKKGV